MAESTTAKNAREFSEKVRKNIEASLEKKALEQKKKLFRMRVDLARKGIRHYEQHKITSAARNFHAYLRVLEEIKDVPEGSLKPTHFDSRFDIHELLLISGVYWDLAKLYDRTSSSDKEKDFLHYLDQFVTFSRGQPFQPVCAESIRKYLNAQKPRHRIHFEHAYKALGGGKCFVVEALHPHLAQGTLWKLRDFRDRRLLRNRSGRLFVRIYYRAGPFLAATAKRLPLPVQRSVARSVDRLASRLFK